ncbi:LysR family transcriptional regulator [Luteolibacter flavescens]|uniref:LysR family transcriptional regulator n=1 Tax=Luteolibacter flavescens TaxID=1859460 RepID=A0ABT3FLV2_9BACT|nr:LysR family transcriptional regulator [Luteolibacter flavescens]MCW1884558.1 LysR family transcriptional regulator [Luteolibacter flavescens]
MELRQVQLFLAAAEEGSITAAARKMNLTQPALSRQIKALEEELDVELFTRGAHSVALTAAGRVLVEEGRKLVERAERVVKMVRAESAGEPLRIGYAPSLAGPLLGLALERFSQVHPRARVQLHDCSSAEMREGLLSGKFDVVVTVPWEGDAGAVQWTQVRQHPMRLAAPMSHPFAGRDRVKLSELNGQRLLLFSRTDYPEYWQGVTRLFRDHGIDAKVAGEFDGVTSLGSAVEAGLGVALIAAGSRIERVAVLALDPEPEPVCVSAGVAAGKETSPVTAVFVAELRAVAAEEEKNAAKTR